MTEKQAIATINQIKAQLKVKYKGKSDEEIDEMVLDMFFKAYCEDHICKEDLIALTELMGYKVKMSVIKQIEKKKKGGKKP